MSWWRSLGPLAAKTNSSKDWDRSNSSVASCTNLPKVSDTTNSFTSTFTGLFCDVRGPSPVLAAVGTAVRGVRVLVGLEGVDVKAKELGVLPTTGVAVPFAGVVTPHSSVVGR